MDLGCHPTDFCSFSVWILCFLLFSWFFETCEILWFLFLLKINKTRKISETCCFVVKLHKIPYWCFCTGFLGETVKFQRVLVFVRKFQRNHTKTQDFDVLVLLWNCAKTSTMTISTLWQIVTLCHNVKFCESLFSCEMSTITQNH